MAEIEIELTTANSSFYGLYSLFSLNFNNSELFKPKRYSVKEDTGEVTVEEIALEELTPTEIQTAEVQPATEGGEGEDISDEQKS